MNQIKHPGRAFGEKPTVKLYDIVFSVEAECVAGCVGEQRPAVDTTAGWFNEVVKRINGQILTFTHIKPLNKYVTLKTYLISITTLSWQQ